MFNRTLVVHQPRHTEIVDHEVHVHRAPTDKSVELLKEMELAAARKFDESISVRDLSIDCVVGVQRKMLEHKTLYHAVLSISGRRLTAEYEADADERDMRKVAQGLRDTVAKEIANQVLAHPFELAMSQFSPWGGR